MLNWFEFRHIYPPSSFYYTILLRKSKAFFKLFFKIFLSSF
nr:MAG TPA: hypothetical protein [Caudoviricetes sp.]